MSELEPCCNSDCGDYEMEDKMNELKPCPFCGTSVVGIEHDGLYRWVECGNMDCNAAGKVFTFLIDVDADHIVANNWNTRPIEDELRAELARRDEIIARLKEDTERFEKRAITYVYLEDTPPYYECQLCFHDADELDNILHDKSCPITLHRALMKELE